jgi:hypothetical protein
MRSLEHEYLLHFNKQRCLWRLTAKVPTLISFNHPFRIPERHSQGTVDDIEWKASLERPLALRCSFPGHLLYRPRYTSRV